MMDEIHVTYERILNNLYIEATHLSMSTITMEKLEELIILSNITLFYYLRMFENESLNRIDKLSKAEVYSTIQIIMGIEKIFIDTKKEILENKSS